MSLSNVWITSDLHLGHPMAAELRGFNSTIEHDYAIVSNMQIIGKRDKLFILGDVVWDNRHLPILNEIPGIKELIIGNHDRLTTREYLKYFTKIHGFRKYKNFWLSHCPIHPQEIYRATGNIHGHIHNGGDTKNIGHPYFNANVDDNNMNPVNFTTIIKWYENGGSHEATSV